MYTTHHVLSPVPPFDFALSARIFSNGDAQIQKYEDGVYWQVIRAHRVLTPVTVRAAGTVDTPQVVVELKAHEKLSGNDVRIALDTISGVFNLNLDLSAFYADVWRDTTMRRVVQRLRGLKSPSTASPFEALVVSIIEQQISLRVAQRIQQRVVKRFGDSILDDGRTYYAFPTPRTLASVPVSSLRECGLSTQKAEYVVNAARLVAEGTVDLDRFIYYENINDIIDELCRLRGVGVWTAEMTIVRGLHKFDANPADDIGLRRAIAHYYCDDRRITSAAARFIAQRWGRWKGLAGFYLIIAQMEGVSA